METDSSLELQPKKNKKLPVKQDVPAVAATPARASYEYKMLFRLSSAIVFVVLGFNFSNTAFFQEYPLFGYQYLAQIIISIVAGVLGYFVVPDLVFGIRFWFERLIINTVIDTVSYFWDLQSKKIQEKRRNKQKEKADIEKQKLDESLKAAVAIDTSILIDGRILELVKLNFIDYPLIVGKEVVDELHTLSDHGDKVKRQRGRRGLDVLKELGKKTTILSIELGLTAKGVKGVDKLLVKYCEINKNKLMTLDFNLQKVAAVSGIKVLNLNSLANSLKTVLLPGEVVEIRIVQQGKEQNQGVGYLDDGTMIIVKDAGDLVGQLLPVKVSKVIQSPAGKIFFCTLNKLTE